MVIILQRECSFVILDGEMADDWQREEGYYKIGNIGESGLL